MGSFTANETPQCAGFLRLVAAGSRRKMCHCARSLPVSTSIISALPFTNPSMIFHPVSVSLDWIKVYLLNGITALKSALFSVRKREQE